MHKNGPWGPPRIFEGGCQPVWVLHSSTQRLTQNLHDALQSLADSRMSLQPLVMHDAFSEMVKLVQGQNYRLEPGSPFHKVVAGLKARSCAVESETLTPKMQAAQPRSSEECMSCAWRIFCLAVLTRSTMSLQTPAKSYRAP